jgi:xylulokinase
LLAAIAVGLAVPDAEWNPPAAIVRPDPAAQEVYNRLYPIYRKLYPATLEAAHALADMQTAGG